MKEIAMAVLEAKVPLVSLNPLHRTLEEVYVDTTQQNDKEARKELGLSLIKKGSKLV